MASQTSPMAAKRATSAGADARRAQRAPRDQRDPHEEVQRMNTGHHEIEIEERLDAPPPVAGISEMEPRHQPIAPFRAVFDRLHGEERRAECRGGPEQS